MSGRCFCPSWGSCGAAISPSETRCLALKVLHVPSEKPERYVLSVMELIEKLEKISDQIEVNSIGETDCIIDYQPKPRAGQVWEWIKTAAALPDHVFRRSLCHHDL